MVLRDRPVLTAALWLSAISLIALSLTIQATPAPAASIKLGIIASGPIQVRGAAPVECEDPLAVLDSPHALALLRVEDAVVRTVVVQYNETVMFGNTSYVLRYADWNTASIEQTTWSMPDTEHAIKFGPMGLVALLGEPSVSASARLRAPDAAIHEDTATPDTVAYFTPGRGSPAGPVWNVERDRIDEDPRLVLAGGAGGSWLFEGFTTAYVRDLTLVSATGATLDLGPHRHAEEHLGSDELGAAVHRVTIKDAWVSGAISVEAPSAIARASCARIETASASEIEVFSAEGAVSWGPAQVAIDREAVQATGNLSLVSENRQDSDSPGYRVSVTGTGSSLAVARTAVPAPQGILGKVAEATLWAGIVSASAMAIKQLATKAVPLYSRIAPDQIARHPTRRRIQTELEIAPGQTITSLARTLSLDRKTVEHHVIKLIAAGALRAFQIGSRSVYGLAQHDGHSIAAAVAGRDANLGRIMVIMERGAPMEQDELFVHLQQIGLRRPAAMRHLKRLQTLGLVTQEEGVWTRT